MRGSHRSAYLIKERNKKFDGEHWKYFKCYYKLRVIGLPASNGLYVIMIKVLRKYVPVYIGRTSNLLKRISSHPKIKDIFLVGAEGVDVIILYKEVSDKSHSSKLEAKLISKYYPVFNGVRSNRGRAINRISNFWKKCGIDSYIDIWGDVVKIKVNLNQQNNETS